MASNVPAKRPLASSSSSMDAAGPSSKKNKMDDTFSMDDESFLDEIDSLEQAELMKAADTPLPPPVPPTPAWGVQNGPAKGRGQPRPPPPHIDPDKDAISFQQLDIDHYVGAPVPGMSGLQSAVVPVLRMYGVTMEGNSVCAHLHGFLPYFYVNLPCGEFAAEHCSDFRSHLNRAVLDDMRSNKDNIATAVVSVEICER